MSKSDTFYLWSWKLCVENIRSCFDRVSVYYCVFKLSFGYETELFQYDEQK